MKAIKLFFLLAPAFFACTDLYAQVTIGGLTEPKKGAILDLNSDVKGGLLLSNVALPDLYTIPAAFPGMDPPPADVNDKFKGALVYNTNSQWGIGVYLWNGVNWTPAGEDCRELTSDDIELPVILTVDAGSAMLSVSTKLSDRCSEGEIFTWSAASGVNFPEGNTGSTVKANFATLGDYSVTVTASNRYSTASASKNLTVHVRNLYGIVGSACLDVKKSQTTLTGTALAIYNDRMDAFANPVDYTKTYKFIHANSYSDLSLTYEDADGKNLITAISSPSVNAAGSGEKDFTVTFNTNIKNLFDYNGVDSSTVKLKATYKNNFGELKTAYLDVRLKDGYCVCPIKTGANTSLNFLCHNMGGLDIISPEQFVTRAHHGDWYKFGTKDPALVNIAANDDYSDVGGWSSKPFQDDRLDWEATNNPCPAGWKVATFADWTDVLNSANDNTVEPLGVWSASDPDNFSAVMKIGNYFYLPAAGARFNPSGVLGVRDYGMYWSGSRYDESTGLVYAIQIGAIWKITATVRTHAMSVRCVATE
jgi:uncharacterized protein (TIGR02145 family)